MEQLRCNQCGRVLEQKDKDYQDYIHVEKQWGFFSEKDLEYHDFYLCEDCYDRLIRGFKIPVHIREVEEVL